MSRVELRQNVGDAEQVHLKHVQVEKRDQSLGWDCVPL